MTRPALRLGLLAAIAALLGGCQSLRSWQGGCPGVYSGLRYYGDQVGTLPFDGKLFFSFDLPFTAIVDTFALPVTAFSDPQRPVQGYPIGCRWRDLRALR